MKIGVFDSGVGGLTVLKEIKSFYTNEYVYLADLFNSPYGEKSVERLQEILIEILDYYVKQKVDLIIIACGTLSSIAISLNIKEYKGIKVVNVIESVVKYIDKLSYEKVYLIATNSTINQKKFENNLLKVIDDVKGVGCPKFVPIIENGITEDNQIFDAIKEYLPEEEMKKYDNECIILGCTHYPILKDEIERYLKGLNLHIAVISPGEAMVQYCKNLLEYNQTTLKYNINTTKKSKILEDFCEKMLNINTNIELVKLK